MSTHWVYVTVGLCLLFLALVLVPSGPFGFNSETIQFASCLVAGVICLVVAIYVKLTAPDPLPAYRCHYCQYDLRGCVSGTCPECGKPYPVAPK